MTAKDDKGDQTLIGTFREFLRHNRGLELTNKQELAAMRARLADQFWAMSEPIVAELRNSRGEVTGLLTRDEPYPGEVFPGDVCSADKIGRGK